MTSGEFFSSKANVIVGDESPRKVVDGTVIPILSVLSPYQDKGKTVDDVQIKANSAFHGLVAAPFSRVTVGGKVKYMEHCMPEKPRLQAAVAFITMKASAIRPRWMAAVAGGKPLLVGMP